MSLIHPISIRSFSLLLLFCAFISTNAFSQDDYRKRYEEFKAQVQNEYDDFRKQANEQYADFIKQGWQWYKGNAPLPLPQIDIPVIPPVEYDSLDIEIDDILLEIKEDVIDIQPLPVPHPISPIQENNGDAVAPVMIDFYGTNCGVRIPKSLMPSLKSSDGQAISDFWQVLSEERYNNIFYDCENIRKKLNLCDWAYVQFVKELATIIYPNSKNECRLFQAYALTQSGFKLLIGKDNVGTLHFLYAADCAIYGIPFWKMKEEPYYLADDDDIDELELNPVEYNEVVPMRMEILSEQLFNENNSGIRTISSYRYENMKFKIQVNKNLIDFYNTYPVCFANNDERTKWRFYARVPLCSSIQSVLFPSIKEQINGKSELEAVNMILNWIQTGFVYEYDNKVWGHDRAFFPDETLYYPYCDCEDRAILFYRLVHDLLGLETVLIYYPGHLASAVHFTEDVKGDHIIHNDRKFVVCDPTIIGVGAPVGVSQPNMDNSKAFILDVE